jgi:hypothetical protein
MPKASRPGGRRLHFHRCEPHRYPDTGTQSPSAECHDACRSRIIASIAGNSRADRATRPGSGNSQPNAPAAGRL